MSLSFRPRLSYANVAATLALVLSSAGGAYAVSTITGADVANSSLTGRDVKDGSLRTKDFKAGQLPQGAQGAQGPRGLQGPEGPAGKAAAATTRTVLTAGDPETTVVALPGLGEFRVNCNTNNGGSLLVQYHNTSTAVVGQWIDQVTGGTDTHSLGFTSVNPGTNGGFVNNALTRRITFDLSTGTGASARAASVVVDLAVTGATCFVQTATTS